MASKGKKRYWLFKQEPLSYSYQDLEREGRTIWDGVTNTLAQRHLRQVQKGDRVFFYHTGKEKAVVGEMVVVGEPRPLADNNDNVVVEVEPIRPLAAVTLAQIKKDPLLKDWDLLRLPRLSIVPVNSVQWRRVQELSTNGENA